MKTSDNGLYQQLSENFPQEMERTVTKGGSALTYIPISEVINRLNKVLGVDKWSMTVISCQRDAADPEFVVAHVRLEYHVTEFHVVTRDGIGGQKIKRTKQGSIVDLGDEFKGAISDALKKAAQTLGVGLYLARSEDAIEIEQVMDATSDPEIEKKSALWNNFVAIARSLDGDQKTKMRESWNAHSNGAAVPTNMDSVSVADLEFIIAEATKLKLS